MPTEQAPAGDLPVDEIVNDALESPTVEDIANDPDVTAAFDRAEALGDREDSGAQPSADDAQSAGGATSDQPAAGGETASTDSTAAPSKTEPAAPWFNDADIQAAEARGLQPYDLYDFGSREEFRKAIIAADRAILHHRQRATLSPQAPAATAQTHPPAPSPIDESAIDAPTLPDGRVNVSYYEKNYDEGLVAAMRVIRAQQDAEIQRAAQAQQDQETAKTAEAQRQISTFLDELDRDPDELFGKSYDEHGNPLTLSQEHYDRRREIFDFVLFQKQQMANAQQAQGLPVALPPDAHFIKQAKSRLYGAELAKREQAQKQERQKADVFAQSRTIRPAAGSTGAGYARKAPTNHVDNPHVLASDPDIAADFARAGIN